MLIEVLLFCVFVDILVSTTGMHRRQIVDTMDSNVKAQPSCYVVTADNRYIMACGFWDKSFRVFLTDTCKYTAIARGVCWGVCVYVGVDRHTDKNHHHRSI